MAAKLLALVHAYDEVAENRESMEGAALRFDDLLQVHLSNHVTQTPNLFVCNMLSCKFGAHALLPVKPMGRLTLADILQLGSWKSDSV